MLFWVLGPNLAKQCVTVKAGLEEGSKPRYPMSSWLPTN